MNLTSTLYHWSSQCPSRIALIEGSGENERSLSYSQLLSHVQHCRQQLENLNQNKDSKILLMQPIGIELYILLLASFSIGASVVIIDPAVTPSTMSYAIKLCAPDLFIGPAKAHLLKLKHSAIRKIPLSVHTSGWAPFSISMNLSETATSLQPPVDLNPDHPALITFTSGSTGLPKAASRSHSFLVQQHATLSKSIDHKEADVDLITLPVFGLANLASGMTSVIADTNLKFPAQADSKKILAQCNSHKVNRCAASPAFFKKLINDNAFPIFQSIYTGGAPVFPNLLSKIKQQNPKLNIVTVYGSTEAEPISHQHFSNITEEQKEKQASGHGLLVGKPVSEIEIKIISAENLSLSSGAIGEIIVSGNHVLKGYLNPEKNKETKISINKQVWHRTGDAGYLDDEGNLWLMGRTSAILTNSAGLTIYPFAIESAASTIAPQATTALTYHNSKITLCYSGEITTHELTLLKAKTQVMGVEHIIKLEKIPLDNRHNAKVDYPALQQLLH